MPPITLGSVEERADPTTDPPPALCGAIEGRNRQPKPSALMSNSTKEGYTNVPTLYNKNPNLLVQYIHLKKGLAT